MFKYLALLLLVSCGAQKEQPRTKDYPALRAQVERVEPLLAWTCDGMIPARKHDFPCIKEGDGTSMAGRYVADSGDRSKLPGIQRSIGPDGRLWRNPARVGIEDPESASRDQLLGVIESGDKESLKRVMAYIKRTGRICPGDDRCNMTASVRMLAEKSLGISHSKSEQLIDIETLWLEAETAPKSYRAYLVGRKLLLHYHFGSKGYVRVAKRLYERFPKNPFLHAVYALHAGKSLDPVAKELTACLEKWEKPGIDWWGDAMDGCTSKQQGHELTALGRLLLGP
jgi:hypothetical protein